MKIRQGKGGEIKSSEWHLPVQMAQSKTEQSTTGNSKSYRHIDKSILIQVNSYLSLLPSGSAGPIGFGPSKFVGAGVEMNWWRFRFPVRHPLPRFRDRNQRSGPGANLETPSADIEEGKTTKFDRSDDGAQ